VGGKFVTRCRDDWHRLQVDTEGVDYVIEEGGGRGRKRRDPMYGREERLVAITRRRPSRASRRIVFGPVGRRPARREDEFERDFLNSISSPISSDVLMAFPRVMRILIDDTFGTEARMWEDQER